MGQSWLPLSSGVSATVSELSFVSDNIGYACGYDASTGLNGYVIKTSDGATWSSVLSGVSDGLYGIWFQDANTGYVVGNAGKIYKTINGGSSWAPLSSGSSSSLRDVFFTDSNTGYVVGTAGTILKTVDAGSSWSAMTSGTSQNIYSVHFTDANNGYAACYNGVILKTTNAGVSWAATILSSPIWLFGVTFTDANNGFVVGDGGAIYKTTNAGASWSPQTSTTTTRLNSVKFLNSNTGYAFGGNLSTDVTTILKTNDGGTTWVNQTVGSSRMLHGALPSFAAGYTCGLDGKILKVSNINAGVDDINVSNVQLLPAPNPFASAVSISLGLKKDMPIAISLYDMSGKKVRDLQDKQNMLAGDYQLTFSNLSDLSNGIYFIRIETPESYTETKLVKVE